MFSLAKTFRIYSLLLRILLCCIFHCHAFNIDIPSRIIHTSSQIGSWFGYSVAMYKHGNINTLLVGAPKYNTTQPGVLQGGAVLSCSVESANRRCEYVPFDKGGNMLLSNMNYYIDDKSNQFFGATLKTENGTVVACAPRYVWFTDDLEMREPVGICYVARQGMTDFESFSPCRTDQWGYHRQGSCQAGFSAALTNNAETLYIGAPGAYYWQGQVHSQNLIVNAYNSTGEGPKYEDNQYLGYSVAAGDFNGDDIQDVALGVPKGHNYTGKLALYSHDMTWIQNITGDQLGSYFGYCLTVIDFNGDQLDDIVVGAPMYTDYGNREMKIEVGKVKVLIQNSARTFTHEVNYFGSVDRGRFGLSVTELGDINLDGFGDFAVGAPYGGLDGRGAVFIYHGFDTSAEVVLEVLKKPAQVIYAAEAGGGFTTFGWSLSGGIDIDGNAYTDLLVGAYESEKAILFKSRPIIKFLEHTLAFESEGKTINLKNKTCEVRPGYFFTCMNLVFCMSYTGVNVDDSIELDVEFRLDTKHDSEHRMLFQSNERSFYKEKILYAKEIERCRTLKTYVKPDLVDKLTPLAANVSYSLIERRRIARSLTPVLDRSQTLSMQDSLTIQKNCGTDNICTPDLVLTFDAPDEFIIGQKELLNVSVRVVNNNEDAFEAAVYISEPKGLRFNKYERRENTSCLVRTIGGNNYLKCDIGNPLPMEATVFFNVLFQQIGQLEEPRFEFIVTANSTNAEERTFEDNVIRKVIEAKVLANLTLFGSSDPDFIIYNTSNYQVPVRNHENHVGPSLVHKYGLLNAGPSDIERAEIMILWPTRTLEGKYLLYLIEEPVTVGKITCDPVPDINPMNLKKISSEERIRVMQLTSLKGSHRISANVDVSESKESTSGRTEVTSSSSSSSVKISSSGSRQKTHTSSSSVSSGQSSEGQKRPGYKYSSSVGRGGQATGAGSSQNGREGYYYSRSESSSSRSGGRAEGISTQTGEEREGTYVSARGGADRGYSSRRGYTSRNEDGSIPSTGTSTQVDYSSRDRDRGSYASSRTGGSYSSSAVRGGTREQYYPSGRGEARKTYSYSARGGTERGSSSTGDGYDGGYSSSTDERGGGRYSSNAGGRVEKTYTSSVGRGGEDGYSYSERKSGTSSQSSSVQGGVLESRYSTGGDSSSSGAEGTINYSSYGNIKEREGSYPYSSQSSRDRQNINERRTSYSSGAQSRGHSSGRQGILSSSSGSRTQSGPVLPSSGTGGKFSSTLFTVDGEGGGGAGGGRNVGGVKGSSGISTLTESERRYHASGSSDGLHLGTGGSETISSHRQGSSFTTGVSPGQERTWASSSSTGGGGSGSYSSTSSRKEYHYSSSDRGTGYSSTADVTDGAHLSGQDGSAGTTYSSSHYERKSPESYRSSYSYQSSSSSSSDDENLYRQNEIESRKKRDVSSEETWERMISECGATLCTRIRCTTEALTTNEDVYVYIRSRLWVDTLNEDPMFKFPVDDVTITTRMVARTEVVPKEISAEREVYSQNIVTPIRSAKSLEAGPPAPWWVILLATLAGILILLLIILILWKLGFFKRQRGKSASS